MTRRCAVLSSIVLALFALPLASQAERAWIKDEVRLNKRTGPGTQYRILSAVKTGDSFEVLSRAEQWTQVQDEEGMAWIPSGYLQPEPPARVQLERHMSENKDLRRDHGQLTTEVEELRAANAELTASFAELDERAKRIDRENIELRAGARWPEWIAGASILLVGGILGMILHASNRRQTRRIRL